MKKFGIYTLVCFTNMIICARAGMHSGEGFLQWFLILMAMINLFMLFSLVDTGRVFSELEAQHDKRREA
ncbi:MAG: hypothetical protein P8J18_05985 [Halieaceae bacterium]|nr:hypothetical protein [Halieaceae bacterium]